MYFKKFVITFSLVLIVLVSYLFYMLFSKPVSVEKDIRSQYLKAGDFELSSNNQPFRLSQLRGRPVILYFGYTSCPDVCPVGLAVIRDVLNSSDEFSSVPVLFITLDPKRDTPQRLSEYVSFFHTNIIPLSGDIEQIQKVITAYGGFLRHSAINGGAVEDFANDYVVDHSAYYYLINAQGELTRVLNHSVTVEEMVNYLKPLL